MNISEPDTPAVLIDETIALENIRAYQAYSDRHGFALRPHIKTHKLPHFARAQLAAGAVGITCQKISEAEIMADASIDDILITYNILGEKKLSRLAALSDRVKRLGVVADNKTVIDGLTKTFQNRSRSLDVMIECDTGAGRCGVQTPQAVLARAEEVIAGQGLNFAGLMTYPKPGGGKDVQRFMTDAIALLREKNIDCPTVSSGGSPDMWSAHEAPVVSEYRIGTYIYNDRSLVECGTCGWENCALTVLTTVVSTPTAHRAVIDAGSKALTSDLIGLNQYGYVVGGPGLAVASLSEEHGVLITADGSPTNLTVGERIRIIPNHCCVVSNMVGKVWLHQSGKHFEMYEVSARGCIT